VGVELSDFGMEDVQKFDTTPNTIETFQRVVDCHVTESIAEDARSCLVGIDAFPPVAGEKLLLLILSREERKTNILGDLTEEYSELAQKFGRRFATIWYYKQAVASAWPMLRKVAKWGLFLWAGELIRRLTH
jgi:hypothetical protein